VHNAFYDSTSTKTDKKKNVNAIPRLRTKGVQERADLAATINVFTDSKKKEERREGIYECERIRR